MLTPAEEVGLRGKQIESRLRRAAAAMPAAGLRRIAEGLRADARRNHVVYERDEKVEAVRIMLRPLAATPDQLSYVHHVCVVLNDAMRRLADLYLADAEVRAVLRLDEIEANWLDTLWSRRHGQNNPIYGRLDALCDFSSAGWRDSLAFMEPNLSGIGGIHYGPVVEQLVMRDLVAPMRRHDPTLRLTLPRDQRELFMQALLEHAEAIGRPLATLAFVEPKYVHSGPDEQRALARFIEDKYGIAVVHADPRELGLRGAEVCYGERVIDLAYRDYEVRDLIALEREGGIDLGAMRRLFADNRMVSSIAGDFDHKSGFELLTDPALAARHFSPEERYLFNKHVLWTRLVRERRTSAWDGSSIDLESFALARQHELVLKPNRSYGGTGVCLGAAVEADHWRVLVRGAFAAQDDPHGQWVLQRAAPIPVFDFPCVADDGEAVHEEHFYTVMGFAPTDHGLGVLCRVSQKQVVNVAQRGGIAALLIADDSVLERADAGRGVSSSGAHETFRDKLRTLRDLDAALGVLGWDEETYMPELARHQRGEQQATLESARHRLLLDPGLHAVAQELAQAADASPLLNAELTHYFRQWRMATAVPDGLVKALARSRSASLASWEEARAAKDARLFLPAFSELLALTRERGEALSTSGNAYDGLLDLHEPGLAQGDLELLLRPLASALVPLIAAASERTRDRAGLLAACVVEEPAQRALVEALLRAMGFDFRRGRLDVSTHPFTVAAGSHDVRLTVRYIPEEFTAALFAALHEGGHGLYDQGFADHIEGTLLAEAPSMGLHESQSRLWENQIGRSRAFWQGFFPTARRLLGDALAGFDAERMYRAVNVVRPGLCRVEADEATYNLHILIRTELEMALLKGELTPADVPGAWREHYARYLGVTPADDLEGCLQDVHWALGALGYFPTYTIGNLYAAMLWDTLRGQLPEVGRSLEQGDLSPVRAWLAREIHVHGRQHSAAEIMLRVTGQRLNAAPFLAQLEAKFAAEA